MAGIFINYRTDEDGDTAELLELGLKDAFGDENVFRDQTDLPLGHDYRPRLWSALENSTVVLVVIGPTWLSAIHADGDRKIDHEDDFVRRELEFAHGKGIPTAMILTRNAVQPSEADLPSTLSWLPNNQRFRLHPGIAVTDIGTLVLRLIREFPDLAKLHRTEREADPSVIISNPQRSPIATGSHGSATYTENVYGDGRATKDHG